VVIAFNGKEVQNVSQLRNLVARTIVGKDAQVKVLRDGKEETITVKVAERPTDEMLAKKEAVSSQGTGRDGVKPPDNCLGLSPCAGVGYGHYEPIEHPGEDDGRGCDVGRERRLCGSSGSAARRRDSGSNHEVVKTLEDYRKLE